MNVLITGLAGFAGSHLAEYLTKNTNWQVWGCSLEPASSVRVAGIAGYQSLNLCDYTAVRDFIAKVQPERIFHLAGQAFVPSSWENPWRTFELNLQTQLNVFQAVVELGLQSRILVVTSLELYGHIPAEQMPVSETTLPRPDTPYAVSKQAQDSLCAVYAKRYDLAIVSVRPQNHIGPRQDRRFVASAFASQIAQIEAGLQSPRLLVGDLSAKRDFTDVRDMVRAYHLLIEHGIAGEAYNVGSGKLHSIQELLEILCSYSQVPITVEIDPARLRKGERLPLLAKTDKMKAITGWQPTYSLEQTLLDLLNYERHCISNP